MARGYVVLDEVLTTLVNSLAGRYAADAGVQVAGVAGWSDVEDGVFSGKEVTFAIGNIEPMPERANGSDTTLPVNVEVVLVISDRLRQDPTAYLESLRFLTDLIAWGQNLHIVNGRALKFSSLQPYPGGFADPIVAWELIFHLETYLPIGIPSLFESTPEEVANYRSPVVRLGLYTGPWPPNLLQTHVTADDGAIEEIVNTPEPS